MRLKLSVYFMHVTNAALLTARLTELNRFRNLCCGLLLDNKDAACFSEISDNVAEFTVKKRILFLTILCMVEPDARCLLYDELTEVLVVQGKLTASRAAIPMQGLGFRHASRLEVVQVNQNLGNSSFHCFPSNHFVFVYCQLNATYCTSC